MPREGKTSITVSDETFEMLKRNKPEGVTWDYHLKQLQYSRDKEMKTHAERAWEFNDG